MEKPVGPLTAKSLVKQEIILPAKKEINSLCIKFGTYCRKNRTTIIVKFEIDNQNNLNQSWTIDGRKLKDNAFYELLFKDVIFLETELQAKFSVCCLSPDTRNSIALFCDDEIESDFYINYQKYQGSIVYDFNFNEENLIPHTEIFGYNGLISIFDSESNLSIFKDKLANQIYNCFEFTKDAKDIQGQYILFSLDENYDLEKYVFPEDMISNALIELQKDELSSYVCLNEGPLIIAKSVHKPLERNLYLDGRWSANTTNPYFYKSSENKQNRLVIYTAIMGDYDQLNEVPNKENGIDYICFTDNNSIKSSTWDIRYVDTIDCNHAKTARMYKILPHRFLTEYETSLWIDGNLKINSNMNQLFQKRTQKIMLMKHDLRDCLYDELQACIDLRKDQAKTMRIQIEKYENEGFPKNIGLAMTGTIIREHNDNEIINVMELWWREVKAHSKRDQLSFNYVAYKNNLQYQTIDPTTNLTQTFLKSSHQG